MFNFLYYIRLFLVCQGPICINVVIYKMSIDVVLTLISTTLTVRGAFLLNLLFVPFSYDVVQCFFHAVIILPNFIKVNMTFVTIFVLHLSGGAACHPRTVGNIITYSRQSVKGILYICYGGLPQSGQIRSALGYYLFAGCVPCKHSANVLPLIIISKSSAGLSIQAGCKPRSIASAIFFTTYATGSQVTLLSILPPNE